MDSKKGLFGYGDVKNHPNRSGFDLSGKVAFTAKVGELLPVQTQFVMPGDKFNLKNQSFTRTMPVNTAAFTRIREYFDWYYVPLRLLGKQLPQGYVQMLEQSVSARSFKDDLPVVQDMPFTTLATIEGILNAMQPGVATPKNQFGFDVSACSAKLLWYLRYGPFKNTNSGVTQKQYGLSKDESFLDAGVSLAVSLLPLAAYQKIYADYFRFSQWEKNEPFTYNFDYYTGGDVFGSVSASDLDTYVRSNNMFTLRYSNWHKDLFMGVMPEAQLGSVAAISVGDVSSDSLRVPVMLDPNFISPSTGDLYPDGVPLTSSTKISDNSKQVPYFNRMIGSDDYNKRALFYRDINAGEARGLLVNLPSAMSSFSVIQLRVAEATQRWKEISQCADQNYRSQIYAHFGVRLSQALSDQCQYIGGSVGNIDISEVVNNNLAGDNAEASIYGKGVGTVSGGDEFTCQEPGLIMCIYHAVPLLDYQAQSTNPQFLVTQSTDFPIPELDSIGMESLPFFSYCNSKLIKDKLPGDFTKYLMGYVPRYVAWKTNIDIVSGAFVTTLQHWTAAITPQKVVDWLDYGNAEALLTGVVPNFNFFKVNPNLLNDIFVTDVDSSWDTDQLLVNAYFDIKVARDLDYNGMPY